MNLPSYFALKNLVASLGQPDCWIVLVAYRHTDDGHVETRIISNDEDRTRAMSVLKTLGEEGLGGGMPLKDIQ